MIVEKSSPKLGAPSSENIARSRESEDCVHGPEMSAESPTLGPGNDLISLEKIQHGIKEFLAQRGMFGDDVKGRRTGQVMNAGHTTDGVPVL